MLRECLIEQSMPEDRYLSRGLEAFAGELPFGAVVGTVDLVDCVPVQEVRSNAVDRAVSDFRWARWAWRLAEPVMFEVPVPAAGRSGLWEWVSDS